MEGDWFWENMDVWLENFGVYVCGISMVFVGLKCDDECVSVFVYFVLYSLDVLVQLELLLEVVVEGDVEEVVGDLVEMDEIVVDGVDVIVVEFVEDVVIEVEVVVDQVIEDVVSDGVGVIVDVMVVVEEVVEMVVDVLDDVVEIVEEVIFQL